MKFFIDAFKKALAVTQSLIAGFNPLFRHTIETKVPGKSFFSDKVASFEDWLNLITTAVGFEQVPGNGGSGVCWVFTFPVVIGVWAHSVPIEGETYEVFFDEDHQTLAVRGKSEILLERTKQAYSAFTVENTVNGKELACATICPGLPDKDPDFAGLEPGMKLTAKEVKERNLRPFEPKG